MAVHALLLSCSLTHIQRNYRANKQIIKRTCIHVRITLIFIRFVACPKPQILLRSISILLTLFLCDSVLFFQKVSLCMYTQQFVTQINKSWYIIRRLHHSVRIAVWNFKLLTTFETHFFNRQWIMFGEAVYFLEGQGRQTFVHPSSSLSFLWASASLSDCAGPSVLMFSNEDESSLDPSTSAETSPLLWWCTLSDMAVVSGRVPGDLLTKKIQFSLVLKPWLYQEQFKSSKLKFKKILFLISFRLN